MAVGRNHRSGDLLLRCLLLTHKLTPTLRGLTRMHVSAIDKMDSLTRTLHVELTRPQRAQTLSLNVSVSPIEIHVIEPGHHHFVFLAFVVEC